MQEERHGHNRPTKFYTLNATNCTNLTNNKHQRGFAGDSGRDEVNELHEVAPVESSSVRTTADSYEPPQTRMDAATSSNSLVRTPDDNSEVVEVDL